MADQQKGVTPQIIAVDELLLQELILLGGEGAWESLREVRDIFATDQVGELRKLLGPSQFGEDGAQGDEPVDIGGGHERRRLGAQTGHPAEEVGLPAPAHQVYSSVEGADALMKSIIMPARTQLLPNVTLKGACTMKTNAIVAER